MQALSSIIRNLGIQDCNLEFTGSAFFASAESVLDEVAFIDCHVWLARNANPSVSFVK